MSKNRTLRVALLQIMPCTSAKGNLQKGKECCVRASDMGADIALFPEMWSSGYDIPDNIDDLKRAAVSDKSEFVSDFGRLARELRMAIGITFLESFEPLPKNTMILFDRNGNRALKYSKVHTCAFSDERRLTPGDGFYVADVDTRIGNIKIGAMICFDREFPESARILMLKGAEIVLAPNACPMEINRLAALRTRAYENMFAVATCNYPAGHPDCNGHSSVFDGIAWLRGESGVRDMCILEAPGEEGIYLAGIDIDTLREYRATEVMGNAYRRPSEYGLIANSNINERFGRAN